MWGAVHRVWLALAGMICACAHQPVPADRSTSALYRDLQRLVSLSGAAGWEVDRVEVEEMLPPALMSVCRVHPERRAELLLWLDKRIAARGGDVADVYRRRGRDLSRVDELLELTRVRLVLEHSIQAADRDCPFWIEPEAGFSGLQILDDRWLISLGGGGKGIVVDQGSRTDLNFGGAGRLLFGRAFGRRWALLAGAEAGASASFPKDDMGERGSLVLGIDFVAPLVVRYRLVNSYAEIEAGPLLIVRETETRDPEPGFHVGVSFGAAASRRRLFLPGAAFGISFERTFPDGQDQALNMFKLGFRVAIDIGI